jgi:hypothetical protein
MNNLSNVVRQLQQERARAAREMERLDAALAALNGSTNHRASGRGRLSTAARARIAAAQRARWAKVRGKAQPVPTSLHKRTLSAAARNRIAAAQRSRWAKFKAAKEKKKAA